MADAQAPCVSLYQPTHRTHPDNQKDPIRYRNLLRQVHDSLGERAKGADVQTFLQKMESLAVDQEFWNYRTEGLAILASSSGFHVFDLQLPVEPLAVVAESYHIKPLLRELQSADRYQVLCLNRKEAKLYEGNRYGLDPVEVTAFPTTLTAALGAELTEPHQTVASYGLGPAGGSDAAMHHGHGGAKSEVEIDTERFFRIVHQGVFEHHSQPSGLPLLLAALPEHQGEFRRLGDNPLLMDEGLATNPDAFGVDQLRVKAWEKVEPAYQARLQRLNDDFNFARSQRRASEDLTDVANAVAAGRVGTLLVEVDRIIPKRFDVATGGLASGKLSEPEVDDVIDDLAEAVLSMQGEVVVVPADRMPGPTGVAAIFRY